MATPYSEPCLWVFPFAEGVGVPSAVDRAQCESTMFVGSGIETVILAGFARGMAQSGAAGAGGRSGL